MESMSSSNFIKYMNLIEEKKKLIRKELNRLNWHKDELLSFNKEEYFHKDYSQIKLILLSEGALQVEFKKDKDQYTWTDAVSALTGTSNEELIEAILCAKFEDVL